jgi:hypothetical protein
MPQKDAEVETLIRDVIGNSRKGRNKVIHLVQRKQPQIGSSKSEEYTSKKDFH